MRTGWHCVCHSTGDSAQANGIEDFQFCSRIRISMLAESIEGTHGGKAYGTPKNLVIFPSGVPVNVPASSLTVDPIAAPKEGKLATSKARCNMKDESAILTNEGR